MQSVQNLLNDVAELRHVIVERERVITERDQIIANQENRIQSLEGLLARLRKDLFGPKSEKMSAEDIQQGRLFNEAETLAMEALLKREPASVPVKAQEREKRGRKPLSENLPRRDIVHDLGESEKICACGAELQHIGQDISERLNIIPQKAIVERHIRHKYACRSCEGTADESQPGVKTAGSPGIIPGSIATPGLLAYIFTGKFCDALPFYRQESIFARIGVQLNRGTMASWAIRIALMCGRLRKLMWDELRTGYLLHSDETTLQVLNEPNREATRKSFLWALRGGDPEKPVVLFHYRQTRQATWLKARLRKFVGVILSDAFKGYNVFDDIPGIMRAGCWSHARRKFVQAHEKSGPSENTVWVLDRIRALYRVEEEARDVAPGKRRKLRKKYSTGIVNEIHEWLILQSQQVPSETVFGNAVGYALAEWDRLIVFLDDGRVPIDNNRIENDIRPYVIGRKNWLFADVPAGAAASAFLYSLIETAKANGHEPYWYLRYLFEKLPDALRDKIKLRALLPMNVTPAEIQEFFR